MKFTISGIGRTVAIASVLFAGTPALAESGKLTVQIWGSTWQSAFEEIAKTFEKKTGIKVEPVTQSTSGEGLVKLQAMKAKPTIDVWFTTSSVAARAATDQELFAKIPSTGLANVAALNPNAHTADWVAAYYYPMGIIYRTDEVKTPITSWRDLWKPEFEGRLAVPSVGIYQGSMLLVAATLEGGSIDDVDPGFAALKKLRPNVALYYGSDAQARQSIAQGEASVLVGQPSHAKRLRDEGLKVKMVSPKPAPMMFDVMMIVRSGNEANAAKFIDFVSTPEMQEIISIKTGMAPVNPAAKPSPELVDSLPAPGDGIAFDNGKLNAAIGGWTERFNREIAN